MKKVDQIMVFASEWAMIGLFMVCAFGCATLTSAAGNSNGESAGKEDGPVPLYYDFGDVPVPDELKVQKHDSIVFRTPDLSAGVLSFKGRVEINSLIAFFENNMMQNNWKMISSFKSPRSLLLFQKANRWCVISIAENDFSTAVEIWVAPSIGSSENGIIK